MLCPAQEEQAPAARTTRYGRTVTFATGVFIHMNARVYDPALGRFLSPDIAVTDLGNSQAYNRYSYCKNNPINATDPTGNYDLYNMPIVNLPPPPIVEPVWNNAAGIDAERSSVAYSIDGAPLYPGTAAYDNFLNVRLPMAIASIEMAASYRSSVNATVATPGRTSFTGSEWTFDKDGMGHAAFTVTYTRSVSEQLQILAENSEAVRLLNNGLARDSDYAGGGSKLPTPTQAQIDGVMAKYGKYFKFEGSSAQVQRMKTLFAQAFLFERPNGKQSIAIREFIRLMGDAEDGWVFRIGFGTGNNTRRLGLDGKGPVSISIGYENPAGGPISSEQMVVSIMHEILHAADYTYLRPYIDALDRHNEIYRLQNQTLYDLGLPLDPGPRGAKIPDNDKYIDLKY